MPEEQYVTPPPMRTGPKTTNDWDGLIERLRKAPIGKAIALTIPPDKTLNQYRSAMRNALRYRKIRAYSRTIDANTIAVWLDPWQGGQK